MVNRALVVELKAVVRSNRDAGLSRQFAFRPEQIEFQVRMPHRRIAGIKRITPMVLRVKHQALRACIARGLNGSLEIDVERLLGRRVKLPLHRTIGPSRRMDTRPRMFAPQRLDIGKRILLFGARIAVLRARERPRPPV